MRENVLETGVCPPSGATSVPEVIIDSADEGAVLKLSELYKYRELLFLLAWRDIRVRYAQTVLGILWAFIQPLVTLFVFTLLFGRGIQVNTGGVPYPIFALAGMSAWSYFSFVMAQAGNSIIGSGDIIKKTYFPRLVIPLSKALVGFVDFSVTLFFLAVLMIFYRFALPPQIIWLPFFVMATVLCGLTIGIWLSAMTIRFRDFQHVIPFLVQLGMYATPVAYPSSLIPHKFIAIYYLNPMAVTVEGFRWAITGVDAPQPLAYLSLVGVGILFVLGLRYFRKVELVMADLV